MDIEHAFILFAIVVLLFIGGLLFLIIYGLVKKKRVLWITGVSVATVCIFMYLFALCGSRREAIEVSQQAREQLKER